MFVRTSLKTERSEVLFGMWQVEINVGG